MIVCGVELQTNNAYNNQSNEITGIGIYVGETILANNSHSMA